LQFSHERIVGIVRSGFAAATTTAKRRGGKFDLQSVKGGENLVRRHGVASIEDWVVANRG
jgi:hypothetical protein